MCWRGHSEFDTAAVAGLVQMAKVVHCRMTQLFSHDIIGKHPEVFGVALSLLQQGRRQSQHRQANIVKVKREGAGAVLHL